jgi:phenylacetate-CoA ligase
MITREASELTELAGLQARMRDELTGRLAVHLPRLNWDADQLASHQAERLRALLGHAVEHSPFHARRLAGLDPTGFDPADLRRLPVMTKAEMMASFDEVVTDRRLDRRQVEDHLLRSRYEPGLLLGEYVCLASGGSSGLRGIFVQTIGEYCDHVASVVRRVAAWHLASGAPGGLVGALVAAAAPVHSTGFAAALLRGYPAEFMPVPVALPLAEAVERLDALQPAVLVGYPSRLAQLGAERAADRLHISPQIVISVAETLTDVDRQAITDGFGAPVVNTFASTEGLVGSTDPGGTELTFAGDMCIAEPVDAAGNPVPAGMPSAKVLVTNLHNFSQPLIRYELGDSFTAYPDTARCGNLRASVNGRDDAAFRYGGVVIHPLAIRAVMTTCAAVCEYQVRQTRRGVAISVVVTGELDECELAASLAASLRKAGLYDPDVAVQIVESVERHPETGKARRFIPLGSDG